jgi:hypothetical protein
MNRAQRPHSVKGSIVAALALASLLLSGCGTPGTPQPPSLKLPEPVTDLAAIRTGNAVALTWTMPRRTTDHLTLESQIKGLMTARICRREGAGPCQTAGEISLAVGVAGGFHDTLPAALATGNARPLSYFVELRNPRGHSAGLSNAAAILAGAAPSSVAGLTAEPRADGVALHWTPGEAADAVRLHRKLLTAKPATKDAAKSGPMQPAAEPAERDLLVETPANGTALQAALDPNAKFGEVYEYKAQRVELATFNGKPQELAGDWSAPIRVNVADTFPPAVPRGLVAVATPEEKSIDLSWEPDTEEDLAGYIVYRAEAGGAWKRISGAQPLFSPAYRDTTAEPGHAYDYAVSAIDQTGNESQHAQAAHESLPNP